MQRKKINPPRKTLVAQVLSRANSPKKVIKSKKIYDGDFDIVISTGSTLLDLAISGGRIRGGGLPRGIMMEVFGPSGSGKTVLLSEIAGDVQRKKGVLTFLDPEARLNKQFAQIFDLDTDKMHYTTPNTVPELFKEIRNVKEDTNLNGIFADSLAALSTNIEMDNDDGDKMGMRRAKEFSEGFRKAARIIQERNILLVASNQIRENMDAGPYGVKYKSPGGEAIGFYSSIRLRASNPKKIKKKISIKGVEVERVIGVETQFEVFKNSVWSPYRKAPVVIIFDYGIDDIRSNLQFLKKHKKTSTYCLNGEKLSSKMIDAISIIENEGLEKELKEEVIDLWEQIEKGFGSVRKKKIR